MPRECSRRPTTDSRSSRRRFLRTAVTLTGVGAAGCLSGTPLASGSADRYPPVSTGEVVPDLRPHPEVENPVLTADVAPDRKFVKYVADPFLVSADRYHLFFEVFYATSPEPPATANIGHAVSDDGLDWEYTGIVLDDPFHLAYPHVFRWNGKWYMTPDKATYDYGGIPEFRIYRGDPFPEEWTLANRALVNEHVGDPTPVKIDDTWYLFSVEQEEVIGTRLHYADSLLADEWTEHPVSPVFERRRSFRPAGRPFVSDGRLHLFIQDVERTYGDKVRCFRVETLTESDYRHVEVEQSPVVESTGNGGWNDDGMHHVDAMLAATGERNVVAVDGKDPNGNWSIGLYELAPSGE